MTSLLGFVSRSAVSPAPVTDPLDSAILTQAEAAAWLKVKPRQLDRGGVPCIRLGDRTARYVAGDVRRWLEAKRQSRTL